ncbi:PfkB family carbohydrate kinase [Candidatus Pelagibacter ubique]|nr:PfkB family carbohydrate kinase [Candidatus Pelagibacter ubique]
MTIFEKKNLIKFLKKNKKKRIVLCHGVFDVVHYGHILHFKTAKELGDVLIVSITKDKFIKKGLNRPIFNESQRYNYLNEIQLIDFVYICDTESAADSIEIIKPKFYVKGPDYKNNLLDDSKKIYLEKSLVEKFKGKIVYTNDKKYSSSTIINNKNLINFNLEQEDFVKKIRSKYTFEEIVNKIKNFNKIKTLLVGELIFDCYSFGEVVGKSGKEPHLVIKENKVEYYVGGTGAIARHLSTFVKNINLICPFGEEPFLKKILNDNLHKNISQNLLKPEKYYSSIIKKRFIDEVSNYKMFGSYILPGRPRDIFYNKLDKKIKSKIKSNDMLIICDYGHEFIDRKIANNISKIKKFKALNVQLNSSNKGFNPLNNYHNFDAVIINQSELRQELREEKLEINILAQSLIKKNSIKNLIVTKGKNGVSLYRKNLKPIHCPAFINSSVDKVGAGDAMLSIISIALKQNLDPEIVLFLGSIAAAINVNNVGNKVAIDIDEIIRIIQFFLR